MSTGRPELAREAFEETLAAARELKDIHQEGVSLDALAEVYIMVGRPEEGRSLAADAIRIFHRLSAPMWLSGAVDTFAVLAIKNSEPLRALRLAGAGLSIRKGSGEPTAQDYQRRMVAYMRPAWDALGDDVGGREFEAGQQLSRDDAVAYALGDRDPFAIASARTKQHSGAKRPNHRERS